MKFILIALLSVGHCSENNEKNEHIYAKRRVAGGGNYGGFIGLTTYGIGPFFVKGKYEGKSQNLENNKEKVGARLLTNVGYEDIQRNQMDYNGNKKEDDFLEYLGYEGGGSCTGQYENRIENTDKYGRIYRKGYSSNLGTNMSRYYDNSTRERCDYLFGYTGPTANDEPENILRPCALEDWQCIRKYFAANSKCKAAYGPIPDPLHVKLNTIFYPLANITVTLPNYKLRGLSNAKVRDFYVNEKSGNLVFAIDIINLNETFPRVYFRYRRTAKESIVLADYATIQHNVTFTAIIPKIPNLRLDLADIHGDLQNAIPPFFFGPGNFNSTDPDVVTAVAQFNLNLPFALREALLTQSILYTSIFIQEYICDFGLNIFGIDI